MVMEDRIPRCLHKIVLDIILKFLVWLALNPDPITMLGFTYKHNIKNPWIYDLLHIQLLWHYNDNFVVCEQVRGKSATHLQLLSLWVWLFPSCDYVPALKPF